MNDRSPPGVQRQSYQKEMEYPKFKLDNDEVLYMANKALKMVRSQRTNSSYAQEEITTCTESDASPQRHRLRAASSSQARSLLIGSPL